MLAKTHDETYFQRMRSSIGDKQRLLKYVKPGTVLDEGAGGGELAELLRLEGNEVWALDGSSEAIERIIASFPEVHAELAFVEDSDKLHPAESFDTVICSSILHEVYSYGTSVTGILSEDAVTQALKAFWKILKPGGVLLIRDGVMPTEWDKEVVLELKTDDAVAFMGMYQSEAPFYSDTSGFRKVHFEKIEEGCYKGSLASAMEFMFTLTWGWNSAPRETQELYGINTEAGYRAALEEVGFQVEHSEQYLQPGYPEHLNPVVDIFDSVGKTIPMPSSNMILVARKL